jgi:hypothetical protein
MAKMKIENNKKRTFKYEIFKTKKEYNLFSKIEDYSPLRKSLYANSIPTSRSIS